MLRQAVLLLPVFIAGLIIGGWALGSNSGEAPIPAPDVARDFDHAGDYERLEQMIESLNEIVNLEVSERRQLEARVGELADQIASLSPSPSGAAGAEAAARRRAAQLERNKARAARQVTEQSFVDAGFAVDVAAQLKQQLDGIEMDRLYLRDQAVREGWLGSARYRNEMRALSARQNSQREQLGPQDYDRYLYALGRPNRIEISNVLSGSPADQAGLLSGDQILAYDGARVFSPGEIRRETSRGESGRMVAVEILRDGQPQVIYIPRGPLGVQMQATATRP